jgi:hypothetical protein
MYVSTYDGEAFLRATCDVERWRLGLLTTKVAAGEKDAAVSATALAGCGRGRDGRGCEGSRDAAS